MEPYCRTLISALRIPLAACAFALIAGAAAAAPAAPFQADATATAQLVAAPKSLGTQYTMRIPPSMVSTTVPGSSANGSKFFGFKSAKHANGTSAKLIVVTRGVPNLTSDAEIAQLVDIVLTSGVKDVTAPMAHPQIGATEHGTIDGMPFERVHATGMVTGPGGKKAAAAVVIYSGYNKAANQAIDVIGEDTAPSSAKILPQMDAAVLTIKRQ